MSDGAELILSKSSIEVWLACHKRWAYGYLYRVPGAPNLDMAVGTGTHAAVEAYWKGESPEEAFAVAMSRELALIPGLVPILAAGAVADGLRLWGTYLRHIVPTFTATMVEKDFLIRVNGVLVSGRIDAADENDVHDTKTTSTPSKVTPERHALGMTIYRHGYRALTGKFPGRLLLDVVAKNGRHKVVEVEPDDAGMAEVVGMVAKGISEGDFRPTGASSGACYGCAYRTMCPDANLGLPPMVESAPDNLELAHEEGVSA